MSYDMLNNNNNNNNNNTLSLRPGCDPFDLPSNSQNNMSNNYNNNSNNNNNYVNNGNGMGAFPFKPLISYTPTPRPHLSMAEQAELEFELRYRGNMIVDQQRKIQQLEEELKRSRDQMDMMNSQITSYEQERIKERKKPQSRYWTPDEHQRFLEALTKYGHKDVKAISMHVSTRNATQVRTHAQKYFLRLERERRKKGDDDGAPRDRENDGYPSSGDELYNSDQSGSPIEELSPPTGISSSPSSTASQPISILLQNSNSNSSNSLIPIPTNNSGNNTIVRRRRSTSLIAPSMAKFAVNHRDAVLAELPTWNSEDYDLFVKGLHSLADKQEDLAQACRAIRDGFLPYATVDDVEACYRLVNRLIKQKPSPIAPSISSPKRRRTSKPELPINMPLITEGILPAMGSMPSSFGSFNGMPNLSSGALPPPQYINNNSNSNNSSVNLLPFQPSLGGLMNMNGSMRPILDYNGSIATGPSSMAPLQMGTNMSLGMSSLGMGMSMMDVSSSNMPPPSSQSPQQQQQGWNSLAFSFDIHQNSPSVALPQGAPLVSSHN